MPDSKVAIINVGVNTTHGTLRSPLFGKRTFEFVPIPDDQLEGLPTYADIRTLGNQPGTRFIPQRFLSSRMHDDPEFLTNTYGDYPETVPRAFNLTKLSKGDSLFYLARLVEWDEQKGWGRGGFYLVGELVLERVVKKTDLETNPHLVEAVKNNAHVKRWIAKGRSEDRNFWVFVGTKDSRRFVHAVPLDMTIARAVLMSPSSEKAVIGKGLTENAVINWYTRACRLIEDVPKIELLREHIARNC